MLEPDEAVPERYYLSSPRAQAFLADLCARIQQGESALPPEIPAIATMRGRDPGAITVGRLDSHQTGGVYSPEGCAPGLKATGYKNPPKIIKIGNLYHRKNNLPDNLLGRVYDPSGVSPALCPFGHDGPIITSMLDSLRIRHLTPRECWRLMGFTDEDFDRAEATGIGRTALYRAAGNSIAVPVLEAVFQGLREHITASEILSDND